MIKEIAILGAGKIGKGYIGDVFNDGGYKLHFLCHSLKQAKRLREQGYYTIHKLAHPGSEEKEVYKITNFDAYSTADERDECLKVLSTVNYCDVALYPGAYEDVGHLLGEAIKLRRQNGYKETLDVFLTLNFITGKEDIKKYIDEVVVSKEDREYMDKYFGIGLALTMRWGGNPSEEMLKDDPEAALCSQSFTLPIDADALKGICPPDTICEPIHHMDELLVYKLWCGNGPGTPATYLGALQGKKWHDEIDDYTNSYSLPAKVESEFGFDSLYDVKDEEKAIFSRGMARGKNKGRGHDAISRNGADPVRKLAKGDRLTGPALACLKAGRIPYFNAKGIAAAFCYDNPEDKSAPEIQAYIKENGISKAITKYCELDLNDREERMLHQLILAIYYDLKQEMPEDIGEYKEA